MGADQPETFVSVTPRYSGQYERTFSDGGLSQPDSEWYRDHARSLDGLAAYRLQTLTLSGSESGTIRGGLVSCNLFDVVRPGPALLGRYLAADECRVGGSTVAVLSEDAWRNLFAADPGVVGRVIQLIRQAFTVVGVAPRFAPAGNADAPNSDREVWVPYSTLDLLQPNQAFFTSPRAQWLIVVGRRQAGASIPQVRDELNALARTADQRVPGRQSSLIVTNGSLLQDPELGQLAPTVVGVSLGTSGILLLLACVNVTTLLLSRAAARQREMAVRLAVGAGRGRLLRQLLTESLLLSGTAAVLGVTVASWAPRALWQSLSGRPAPFDLTPDWRVLAFSAAIAVTAGLIAGLSPAVESLRPGAADGLKGSSTAITPGRGRSRLRGVLVGGQVALSLTLLVQAGLFSRAQQRFLTQDPGFETRQVVGVTLESVRGGYQPPPSFYTALESRTRALPGVSHVGYGSAAPWAGRSSSAITEVDGVPVPKSGGFDRDPARRQVSPEFFAALGVRVTRGRGFLATDRPGATTPTIVSEAMAARYWPGQDPIGRHFRTGGLHEVVGVSANLQSVRYLQDDGPFFYAPLDPAARPASMFVRVAGDTSAATGAIRTIIRELDPQMAASAGTLAETIEQRGTQMRPVWVYSAVAGLLALALALTGVHAVAAFSVSQRTRELAIRAALGATRRDVVGLVVRSSAVPVVGDLAAGVGLTLAAARAVESMLFGLDPRDPAIMAAGAAALLLCALAAVWIPARRAAARDPLPALRSS